MEVPPTRLSQYEDRTAAPLTVLAVAFLFAYATPIIWQGAPDPLTMTLRVINIVLWLVFAADLVTRCVLSGRPLHYALRHPIDVLLVVLPMLRPLRILRVFTALQMLIRHGGRVSVGETLGGAVGATVMLMVVAAVAILDAERGQPGSTIQNYGDSLWWSAVTATTIGYGDVYPVTPSGRIVAFGLMLVGISMIGVVTASIAAWFVGRNEEAAENEVVAEIRALREQVAQLLDGRLPDGATGDEGPAGVHERGSPTASQGRTLSG